MVKIFRLVLKPTKIHRILKSIILPQIKWIRKSPTDSISVPLFAFSCRSDSYRKFATVLDTLRTPTDGRKYRDDSGLVPFCSNSNVFSDFCW